jgi:hypothetical protein
MGKTTETVAKIAVGIASAAGVAASAAGLIPSVQDNKPSTLVNTKEVRALATRQKQEFQDATKKKNK